MPIPLKRRRAIIAAHGGVCFYCGATATAVDHIVSPRHGGTDDLGNLITACIACNSGKGHHRLAPDHEQRATEIAEALRETVLQIESGPQRSVNLDQRVPVMMTESMVNRLDAWRRAKGIDSRSDAVRAIIEDRLRQAG